MGFLANLLGRSNDGYDYEAGDDAGEASGPLPDLHNGMTLSLETPEGEEIFSGRVAKYSDGDTSLTLERLPGALSLKTREIGTSVFLRGYDDLLSQFVLKGTVQESTRLVCKVKDLKMKPIPEQRQNFRLRVGAPATLYYCSDETRNNPEKCTLVNISTGGACLESEFIHAEDEVLRLKIKLENYAPMEFVGEIIRAVEIRPGKFRYGFLFAQLEETELTELTRTLYNLQVGNKLPWRRSGPGDPGHW